MIDGRVCRRVREKGCGRSVLLSLLDVLICAGLISIAAEGSRCFGFGLRRVFPAEMILNLRRQAYEALLWVIKMSSQIKIKRLERYHSICYLRGALQLGSNHGYPCLCAYLRSLFLPHHKLALEAVALRQQLAVFKRRQPRPKLDRLDRLFWIALRRLWEGWSEALIIVKPETVVSWHRAGFRRFWRWRSQRRRPGRPQVNAQIRQLIRRMKAENPTWGAPRIHGELLQLGVEISEPTVSRYLHNLTKRLSG